MVTRDVFQAWELAKVRMVDVDVAAAVEWVLVKIFRLFIGKDHDSLLAMQNGVQEMGQIGIIMELGH